MTDISQLPTTINPITLQDILIVSQQPSGGGSPVAVQASLAGLATAALADPPSIGSKNPNTGAFSSVLIGTGTTGQGHGIPYQFQSAINYDPSVAQVGFRTSVYRQNIINTTLAYASNTTNIWENMFSAVTASGPGEAQGEINCLHGYLEITSGAVATVAECVEASLLNNGTLKNWCGHLAIATTGTVGTSTSMSGFKAGLTNHNTAADAIDLWVGFQMSTMQGGGAKPKNYYAFRNDDTAAAIMTTGGVVIGATALQRGPGTLFIQGADSRGETFSFTIRNLSRDTLLFNNAGDLTVSGVMQGALMTSTGMVQTGTYTVSTLPTASLFKGARAFVTDATAPTFLGALTGGGTVVCPVFSNGTDWVAG